MTAVTLGKLSASAKLLKSQNRNGSGRPTATLKSEFPTETDFILNATTIPRVLHDSRLRSLPLTKTTLRSG